MQKKKSKNQSLMEKLTIGYESSIKDKAENSSGMKLFIKVLTKGVKSKRK